MKNLFYWVMLTFGLLILISCEESTEVKPDDAKIIDLASARWNETVENVAIDITEKLDNQAFRIVLKNEVLRQFDGDYNILISSFIERLPLYIEYENKQNSNQRSSSTSNSISDLNYDYLKAVSKKYPRMQIAVQTNPKTWDAAKDKIGVVYVPAEYDEKTSTYVDGFDKDKNNIQVSTLVEPTENFVVISQNERTYTQNSQVYMMTECGESPIDETEPYGPPQFDEIEPNDDCGGGSGGGSSSPYPVDLENYSEYVGTGHTGQVPSRVDTHPAFLVQDGTPNGRILDTVDYINGQPYFRENFKYERIRELRCDDPSDIEHWTAGKLELRVNKYSTSDSDFEIVNQILAADFGKIDRHDMKDEWHTAPANQTHLWRFETTGTSIGYFFFEHDDGIDEEDIDAIGDYTDDILIANDLDTTLNTLTYEALELTARLQNDSDDVIGYVTVSTFSDEDTFYFPEGDFRVKS